jgi:hypothetical protein
LRAIVVPLEHAHIRWKSPDSYDQWDAIAQTLWEQIVVDALSYHISEHHKELLVPKYDLTYEDYSTFSFVEARLDRTEASNLAMVALSNSDSAFDRVRCDELDASGLRVDSLVAIPLDRCVFVFRHRQADGSLHDVAELEIDD